MAAAEASHLASRAAELVILLDAVKSDTIALVRPVRAIRATVAGNISLVCYSGATVVCAFAAGETRNIFASRINSTGTTATGMEGMV